MSQKKSKNDKKDIETLAAFVHGALTTLHTLGVIYNYKNKNYSATFIHLAVGVWDCVSAWNHMKAVKNEEEKEGKKS